MTVAERKALLDKAAWDVFAVECEALNRESAEIKQMCRQWSSLDNWKRIVAEHQRTLEQATATDKPQ